MPKIPKQSVDVLLNSLKSASEQTPPICPRPEEKPEPAKVSAEGD